MKLIIVWILAAAFSIDSIIRFFRTNFNAGTLMMYLITVFLLIYAVFHSAIDRYCAAGFGCFIKIFFLLGCCFFILIMFFIAGNRYKNPATGSEDAVVVLGAGLRGTRVSGVLASRLDAAYAYYEKNPAALFVVTGGQGPGEDIPEAQAMKAYLVEKGIPADRILEEDKSVSTEENFRFAHQILIRHGLQPDSSIAYVTSGFHCYRAGKYAAKAGFQNARSIASPIGISSILPCYMRETLAVLYYWIFKT